MTVRRALVTGASSGIGTAAALELAREGVALWITYAGREAEAVRVAEECRAAGSPDVHVSRLDLREPDSIAALIAEITDAWGDLHVLVNNGGVCPYTPYPEIDIEEWTSSWRRTPAAPSCSPARRSPAPGCRRRPLGHQHRLDRRAGRRTADGHPLRGQQGAILAITRSFARHLAAEGIRVNAVTPDRSPARSRISSRVKAARSSSRASPRRLRSAGGRRLDHRLARLGACPLHHRSHLRRQRRSSH